MRRGCRTSRALGNRQRFGVKRVGVPDDTTMGSMRASGILVEAATRVCHSSVNRGPGPRDAGRGAGVRLVSPSDAATYLGLGSRFAIYRLVASGQLPAVRIASKLRLDLRDLDAAIDEAKDPNQRANDRPRGVATRPRAVPRELAPRRLRKRRGR